MVPLDGAGLSPPREVLTKIEIFGYFKLMLRRDLEPYNVGRALMNRNKIAYHKGWAKAPLHGQPFSNPVKKEGRAEGEGRGG